MIYINENDDRPLYLQIYDNVRSSILSGAVQKDTPLPPIRVLSKNLKVSKNTVEHAYQELLDEGLIRSVVGSGYYVNDISGMRFSFPTEEHIAEAVKHNTDFAQYDFRYSVGDTQHFPWTKWKQYVDDAVLTEASNQFGKYESNKGSFFLRDEIRGFLKRARGVECETEQVIICAGTQYALETVLSLLPAQKKRAAFEDPGYIGMRQVFLNCGFTVNSIGITSDGIDINQLDSLAPDVIYLTPSRQFPTGVTTSLEKRIKILEWAKLHDAYIIENDYDSEFMQNNRVIPSIQALGKGERVIYLGTLSKAISPSIRCAYYILPKPLVEVYEEKYKHYNSALPSFVQLAIANFIKDGHLEKYIRKVSVLSDKKFKKLSDSLKKYLPKDVETIGSSGTHILVRIRCCTNERELIAFMKERGIGIHGIKKNYNSLKAPENVFILGFSSISEEKIESYVKHLADALNEFISSKQSIGKAK